MSDEGAPNVCIVGWARNIVARKNMGAVPVMDFTTPRGCLKISTPEATAFDLVGHPRHAADLDNAATVLAELAENEPEK